MVGCLLLRDEDGVDGFDLAEGLAVCFEDDGVEVEASAFLLMPGIMKKAQLEVRQSGRKVLSGIKYGRKDKAKECGAGIGISSKLFLSTKIQPLDADKNPPYPEILADPDVNRVAVAQSNSLGSCRARLCTPTNTTELLNL